MRLPFCIAVHSADNSIGLANGGLDHDNFLCGTTFDNANGVRRTSQTSKRLLT